MGIISTKVSPSITFTTLVSVLVPFNEKKGVSLLKYLHP